MNFGTTFTVTLFETPAHVMVYVDCALMVGAAESFVIEQVGAAPAPAFRDKPGPLIEQLGLAPGTFVAVQAIVEV
jgi:hypothetical protein